MDISRYLNFTSKWQLLGDILLWTISGLILLLAGHLLKHYLASYVPVIINAPEPIRLAAFILYLILLFIFLKNLTLWFFRWNKRNKTYVFQSQDWPNEWIFNGGTEISNRSELFVKSSRAGCLLKKYYWKNFCMTFEMKFEPNRVRFLKNLGLIFRAEDLDNYFMLEIIQDNPFEGGTISGIGPQVRFRSGWEGVRIEEKQFNLSDWTKIKLKVYNKQTLLYINNQLIFQWTLPTHVDITHWEEGVKNGNSQNKEAIIKSLFADHVQKIPFRDSYGMVGFRAHMLQGARIRGLEIKPL